MTKNELLDYLTDCKDLELTLYNLEREKKWLLGMMSMFGNANDIQMPDTNNIDKRIRGNFNDELPLFITAIILVVITLVISTCVGIHYYNKNTYSYFWPALDFLVTFVLSLFVVGLISLVVGFVLIIIENSICENIIQGKIKREYQNQLAIRNMKVQQDMQRVLNENKVKPNVNHLRKDTKTSATDLI